MATDEVLIATDLVGSESHYSSPSVGPPAMQREIGLMPPLLISTDVETQRNQGIPTAPSTGIISSDLDLSIFLGVNGGTSSQFLHKDAIRPTWLHTMENHSAQKSPLETLSLFPSASLSNHQRAVLHTPPPFIQSMLRIDEHNGKFLENCSLPSHVTNPQFGHNEFDFDANITKTIDATPTVDVPSKTTLLEETPISDTTNLVVTLKKHPSFRTKRKGKRKAIRLVSK